MPRYARLVHVSYAVITGILAVTTALLVPVDGADPLRLFPWIAGASVAVIASMIWMAGVWTATGAYGLVFWCFHFGLIAVLASGYVGVEDLSVWDLSWLLGPHAADASVLALAGMLAWACGASIVFLRRGQQPSGGHAAPAEAAHSFGPIGSLMVLGAVATWSLIVVATGGLTGFFVSYIAVSTDDGGSRARSRSHLAGARMRHRALGLGQSRMAQNISRHRVRGVGRGGAADWPAW